MSAMNYNGSKSIGLLMLNASSYNYPMVGFGFTSQHQSDGDPIGDEPECEQTYHSHDWWLSNELDPTDLFFNCKDPYDNQNGCRMENMELILLQNEDQVDDYNGDSRNLYYEFSWDCFQFWFGLGEDEQGQELKPENDCSSDALALLEAILGY